MENTNRAYPCEPTPAPAAPAAPSAPAAPAAKRRVGSWTLGLVLIACGCCLLAYHFVPQFDYLLAAKLSPVVLVALGLEVLVSAARPDKRKYDFFSIFASLALMAAALCVSFIPVVWEYIGPGRSEAVFALERQAEDALYEKLKGGEVQYLNVSVSLSNGQTADNAAALAALDGSEYIYLSAELTGPYEDAAAFAAAARTVADAVQTLPAQVDELTVFWNEVYESTGGVSCHAQLCLNSPYQQDWSAEQMADAVEWTYRDVHGSEITKEQWLAGETAETADETFYEEYEDEYIHVYHTTDGGLMVDYKVEPGLWDELWENGMLSDPLYEDETVWVRYDPESGVVVEYKAAPADTAPTSAG